MSGGSTIHALFLLVDGLGLGPADPTRNPLYSGVCPHLQRLLDAAAVPVDAALGVPGVPQSATGQTTLLTGVNAAAVMGRHVEGFPGPALRTVIETHNVYERLGALGVRCTFANAYFVDDLAEVERRKHRSVTTVAALHAFGCVRTTRELLADQAVYHDLTRRSLVERGYTGPLIAPATAAAHLMGLAGRHDFTVFEYFLTDRAGHKGTAAQVADVLREFDEFIGALLGFPAQPGGLLVLTSDHGNIEDPTTARHTLNPVPLVALGAGAAFLKQRVRSLPDVAPALAELYGNPLLFAP
jgi:2,3-bisphosphoglycerate-independent phosphoglycerate mutase